LSVVAQTVRRRDAARSREAVIAAATELFSERGYDGTSLAEIARAAGLARATPGYLFRSKAALYQAVLEHVHAERTAALTAACAGLHAWAGDEHAGRAELREALNDAVSGYLGFLDRMPAFGRLIGWESLSPRQRLPGDLSTSLSDALRAVRRVAPGRGLAEFDVETVVVAMVSLCFLPVAHASTFRAGGGIDTAAAAFRLRYRRAVVDTVLQMLA
jgi:TetR/AcrR family transcriptional regulator